MRQEKETSTKKSLLMKITVQGGISNTTLIGGLTIRRVVTFSGAILIGYVLLKTKLFEWNYFAIAAYIAFVSIVLGQTPTGRNLLTNLYGIIFKKPANMLVTEDATTTTIGHGIKEVILDMKDLDVIPFQMVGTKNYALVYNITSDINRWSSEMAHIEQAQTIKTLYNILEGGESFMIVEKQDNDTGMLKLREALQEREQFEGDDLTRMSDTRSRLLYNAGTNENGRSIQQYGILFVKPKNITRTVNALRKTSRLIRPATNPGDILLSVMGFEGGVEWMHDTSKEENGVK